MTPPKTFNECLLNVRFMKILKSDRQATNSEILEFKKAVKIIKKENPIYNEK